MNRKKILSILATLVILPAIATAESFEGEGGDDFDGGDEFLNATEATFDALTADLTCEDVQSERDQKKLRSQGKKVGRATEKYARQLPDGVADALDLPDRQDLGDLIDTFIEDCLAEDPGDDIDNGDDGDDSEPGDDGSKPPREGGKRPGDDGQRPPMDGGKEPGSGGQQPPVDGGGDRPLR